MNIFDLHASVVADYRDFVRSFFTVADERARAYVQRAIDEEARLWPDLPSQLRQVYGRHERCCASGASEQSPRIMLTNYVMAELLLVRPDDQRFLDRTWERAAAGATAG